MAERRTAHAAREEFARSSRGRCRGRGAVAFAEAGTLEDVGELERFVLMDEVPE
jgi:hypothetical protein